MLVAMRRNVNLVPPADFSAPVSKRAAQPRAAVPADVFGAVGREPTDTIGRCVTGWRPVL